jgi:acyl-CoA reductase-like NAD-dependent aldehyde dehydrogenase
MRFGSEEEAIRLANDTRYGLAAYVHTSDVRRAHRVAHALEAGNVWVNGFFGVAPSMPFGGVKSSGYGRVGGLAGLREFLRPKNVWLAL